MMNPPRITGCGIRVLDAFMSAPDKELSGADISRSTGVFTGTLYPLLIRYDEAGWLSSYWEMAREQDLKRPRRRYYRITPAGQAAAQSIAHFQSKRPAWAR